MLIPLLSLCVPLFPAGLWDDPLLPGGAGSFGPQPADGEADGGGAGQRAA